MRYTWGYILNPFESWSWCRMQQPACKAGYRALSTLHQCFLICTKCLWDLRHWLQPVMPGTCLFETPDWDLLGALLQPYNHNWYPPSEACKKGLSWLENWQGKMFFMTGLYLWVAIPLELKYANILREYYEDHPVIHKYLFYCNI